MTRRMVSWALPLILLLGGASGTASAVAYVGPTVEPETSVFDFTGLCSDCNFDPNTLTFGNATAELTLSNFTLGEGITKNNFVSFHYDGTDLLKAFTIDNADVISIEGYTGTGLPSPEDFYLEAASMSFYSTSGGSWCAGPRCDADYGQSSSYAMAAAVQPAPAGTVPEPMPVALLTGGLLAAVIARRKRD